jgi:hypothetical protein
MSRYEPSRFRITTWPPTLASPVQVGVPAVFGFFSTYKQVLDTVEQRYLLVDGRGTDERARVVRDETGTAGPVVIDRVANPAGALVVSLNDITVKDVAPDLFLRTLYGTGRDLNRMLVELGPLRVPAGLLEEARDSSIVGRKRQHPEWHWRSLCGAVDDMADDPSLRGEELPLLVKPRSAPGGVPLVLHAFSLSQQESVVGLYRGVVSAVIRLTDLCSEHGASALEKVQRMWTLSGWPVPNTADQAVLTASRILNLTTAGCGPRLDLAAPQGSSSPANATAADLLSTLAAQMVAHVSVGAPARRCAHTPCGHWFSHHQGRAEHDRHRSRGVRYCSSSCARAAAQRAYRARQKPPPCERPDPGVLTSISPAPQD